MAEEGGEGGGGGAGEGQSTAQKIAYNVGVAVRLVNQTSESAGKIVSVMERVKKLFTSTQAIAKTSGAATGSSVTSLVTRISSIGQAAGGGGGGLMGMVSGLGMAGMAASAVSSAVSGISSAVVGLHQSSEDMTNTMAGTFTALGFATDIAGGVDMAETALQRINAAAATLPGEASEYITVFQAGISSLASGFNNNLDQMLTFSNQFSAIGRSLGIDAAQIGRDMNLMTRAGTAGAGADVATFQRMLPFINSYRTSMHQAAISAQSFNAMTQPQRMRLLQGSFAALQPMIERAGQTYSAIAGEFEGHMSGIQRAVTAPLFDALKNSMRAMNGVLSRYEDSIKRAGSGLMTFVLSMTEKLGARLGTLFNGSGPLSRAMDSFRGRAGLMFDEITNGGTSDTTQLGGVAAGAGAMAGGPVVGVLIGGIMSFLTHTEAVGQTMASLVELLDGLMVVGYQVATIFGVLSESVGSGLAVVLPVIADFLANVANGLGVFLGYINVIVQGIAADLAPAFEMLGSAFSQIVAGIRDLVVPFLEALGITLLRVWQNIREYVVPAFTWLARGIEQVMTAIGNFLSRIGAELRRQNAEERIGLGADDPISRALERLSHVTEQGQQQNNQRAAAAGRGAPAARGGNHTHNDFRGSNFDITQKFAEGFDPDRIAAGFISDLESAATNRIQGGFEPLFSIR